MANTQCSVHVLTISVNEQPVEISGPKVTGLEIKREAVAQGLEIQLDFVLSEELPNGRTQIIGDCDEVTINKNSRFIAIPNDDNS